MPNTVLFPDLHSLLHVLQKGKDYQELANDLTATLKKQSTGVTIQECSLYHQEDEWDSKIFQKKVGKVNLLIGENVAAMDGCVKTFFSQCPYEYVVARISQQMMPWIQAFEKAGAVTVDTTVDMVLPTSIILKSDHPNAKSVQPALPEMRDQLLECADAFCFGRFFQDPNFLIGKKVYREWIANSLLKKAADGVLVFSSANEKVQGLLSWKIETLGPLKIAKIPLVVKHPSATEHGVAETLLTAALQLPEVQAQDVVIINTQGNNIPAQRSYLKQGFRPYHTNLTVRYLKENYG